MTVTDRDRVYSDHTPTDAEIWRVSEAMHPTWVLAFDLLADLGCRVSELLDAKADQLRGPRLTLHGKTGTRVVWVGAGLLERIGAPDDRGHLLDVGPVTARRQRMGQEIRRACERAGVEPFSAHGLRRAAVRRARRKGVSAKVAAEHFGHSPVVMLRLYDEATEADMREGARRLRLDRSEQVIEGPWASTGHSDQSEPVTPGLPPVTDDPPDGQT